MASNRIGFPASSLRDPFDSSEILVSTEGALGCDGILCGLLSFSTLEAFEGGFVPPHWHVILRGREPDAGPRTYPVWHDYGRL